MVRIKKVKLKDGRVELLWEEKLAKSEKDVMFKCSEPPHPDFEGAMVRLVPLVYEILEFPEGWKAGQIIVTGVSFSMSEDTGVEGAVITGQIQLNTSQAPFCFNTPHLPFEQYTEGGEAPLMSDEGIELLGRLREEATDYMTGKKRAQLDLLQK